MVNIKYPNELKFRNITTIKLEIYMNYNLKKIN